MSEKGVFMVATLVDWEYSWILDKTMKDLKKIYKKHLRTKKVKKNQLNTFVITEAEIDIHPARDTRIKVEELTQGALKKYADSINELHHKQIQKQRNIKKIYEKALTTIDRIDLFEEYVSKKQEKYNTIEKQIEIIGREGSVIIWDLPGYEGDKLILPEVVATFEGHPQDGQSLVDVVDEVLIANFSKQFLPFSDTLMDEVLGVFITLEELVTHLKPNNRISNELVPALQTFIGVISGIQEVLKLFTREITKVSETSVSSFEYLKQLPSADLQSWVKGKSAILGENINTKIEKVMDIIIKIKPRLRDLLISDGDIIEKPTDEFLNSMIDIDVTSGGLLAWVHRFHQLPSFTSIEEGIAYEQLEGETFWPMEKDALIEAQRLFKTFTRGSTYIYALRGVSLNIKQGEFIVIQGPSGAGKTTLLNILAGLDTPGRGVVFFDGHDLVNMKDGKRSNLRRDNFSFIFQSYALIPHLTAYENAKLPLDLSGLSDELVEDIQNILDDVGIGEFSDHKPALLSGGQMQRLGIARALANKPKVLFADEPTGDLDEETGMSVMKLLKKYHNETGMTIILVTHDEKVAQFATRKIFLMDGRIVDNLEG